ncbi:GNAT family N-acetyltransferase [uncultured Algimonas sp.]|uniref:GNAT family N-acetyltransferase n=1 Tax=uncultured Algimonas sp. TaxID=1547920 RepID=UPI0026232792|nr:GNAT family N-acetyltransferase [uncultured Algimonas sp.]
MTFDFQPVLSDDLVRLRPMRQEDFEPLFSVASDPAIWAQHPASDRYLEPVFRTFFDGGMQGGGAFAILEADGSRMIGSTRYHGYDPDASEVEIGWTFLARSHWGGPWNRAVKHLMLDHAFRFVDRVILHAGPDNHRSWRAIEKIGGRPVGERSGDDGRVSLRYAVTRETLAI